MHREECKLMLPHVLLPFWCILGVMTLSVSQAGGTTINTSSTASAYGILSRPLLPVPLDKCPHRFTTLHQSRCRNMQCYFARASGCQLCARRWQRFYDNQISFLRPPQAAVQGSSIFRSSALARAACGASQTSIGFLALQRHVSPTR
jgi:hypothetical protein